MKTKLRQFDLGWLVGWLDGEGSFCSSKSGNRRYVRISASNTDKDTITRVAGLLSVNVYGPCKVYGPTYKPIYKIGLAGQKAAQWASILYPHMSKRRQQQIKKAFRQATTPPVYKLF